MPMLASGDASLFWREDGSPDGAPLVLANSLGTELSLWDEVVAQMPPGLRIVRYDMRGHGRSSAPAGPYSMGALIRDAERLLDHLGVRDCVFVGLSLGGMVAQGLAVKRLDQIRALVLSNTAAKIGTKDRWERQIAHLRGAGLGAISDEIMEAWFGPEMRRSPARTHWQAMLERCDLQGYLACCAAIAGTDFYTPTSGLRLPALGIAGSEDQVTPPDLVRETLALIPGSRFQLMRRVGHLPCVEDPKGYTALLTDFLQQTGHITR